MTEQQLDGGGGGVGQWLPQISGSYEMTNRAPHLLVVINTRDELTSRNTMYIWFSFR